MVLPRAVVVVVVVVLVVVVVVVVLHLNTSDHLSHVLIQINTECRHPLHSL